MRIKVFYISAVFSGMSLLANAQILSLLPENFTPKKGEKIAVHFISGDQFNKDEDGKYQASETESLSLFEGTKKVDASAIPHDSGDAQVLSFVPKNEGMVMLDLALKPAVTEVDREKFIKYLDDQGFSKLSDKAKNSNLETFRVKSTWFLKTLVAYEKTGGGAFDKLQNQTFDIVLQQNPFKKNYGDDITAVVYFKGKPVQGAAVTLYVRTVAGNVYPQLMMSDNTGEVYFKLSREGLYMLHAVTMDLPKDRGADFESWDASFTFSFSSANDLPNSYKSFGFGNKH
jgi:hypothetical protein